MLNPGGFDIQLRNLEREVESEDSKLHAEEAKIHANETEKARLDKEISDAESQIHAKESEIAKLKQKVLLDGRGEAKLTADHTRLTTELNTMKLEQSRLHQKISDIQRSHENMSKEHGVDLKRR